MKKKTIVLLCLVTALVGGIIAYTVPKMIGNRTSVSNVYPAVSQEEMIKTADLIVTGKFTGHGDAYPLDNRAVGGDPQSDNGLVETTRTRYSFAISTVIKGTPYDEKTISIRVEGDPDDPTSVYEDQPKIQEGGEYLLFLFNDSYTIFPEDQPFYEIFQASGGLFALNKNNVWSNQLGDRTFDNNDLKNNILNYKDSEPTPAATK